jgi:hypothetical protein
MFVYCDLMILLDIIKLIRKNKTRTIELNKNKEGVIINKKWWFSFLFIHKANKNKNIKFVKIYHICLGSILTIFLNSEVPQNLDSLRYLNTQPNKTFSCLVLVRWVRICFKTLPNCFWCLLITSGLSQICKIRNVWKLPSQLLRNLIPSSE